MRSTAIVSVAAALLLIVGCAQFKTAPAVSSEPPEATPLARIFPRDERSVEAEEVQMLMGYYQRMAGASAEDLRREFVAESQVFVRDKAESARIKLALLMSIPGVSFRDDARLMNLLDDASSRTSPPESPRRQLVTLLARLTGERTRQVAVEREALKKVENEMKEQQRRAEEQQKRADTLQKHASDLQDKLDKLLAIDREMRHSPRRLPR